MQEITALFLSYGWLDMGPQKKPYMVSFRHEECGDRMNIDFTTMTVTIQNDNGSIASCKDVDIDNFETILTNASA